MALLTPAAIAQSFPAGRGTPLPGNLTNFDASSFSQDVTDAVTQGFRYRDRSFFEDGTEQFERDVQSLQQNEPATPILTVEPNPESWQQIFESGGIESN